MFACGCPVVLGSGKSDGMRSAEVCWNAGRLLGLTIGKELAITLRGGLSVSTHSMRLFRSR